jgi:hypothetical protein
MKPIIVENSKIPKALSIIIEIGAITLWPFIFFRGAANKTTLNHEKIHIRQYNELLVIGFLVLYSLDWLWGMIKYKNGKTAYARIRFEQEAYENQYFDHYLESRARHAWKKYKV